MSINRMSISRIWLAWPVLVWLAGCAEREETVAAAPPYPASDLIEHIEFDWSSHRRLAAGSDNWALTWGGDGVQYAAWGDGGGFGGGNRYGRVSLGVGEIRGDFANAAYNNIWGGIDPTYRMDVKGKSYALLMVDGRLLMWVSPGSNDNNYRSATLHSASPAAAGWEAVDWSFSKEDGLVLPAFLQFGPNYAGALDENIYIYFIGLQQGNKLQVQVPGQLFLLRVNKDKVLLREHYRFFSGIGADGRAQWSERIEDRQAVFSDPAGVGWTVSVSYNPEIDRYLLATEHSRSFRSNMGLFAAQTPWGPWRTVHYGRFGAGEIQETVFYYNFSNSWNRGQEFVLVFSGVDENDSWNAVRGRFVLRQP